MDSNAGDIFVRALQGCHELEQAFPSDDRLKLIVRSLEQWAAPRTAARMARVPLGAVLFDAQHQALAALNGIVNREALVMSFNDTFFATGLLILVFLPLVLLLGKADKGVKIEAGH